MRDKPEKIILYVAIGAFIAILFGGMFDYFPFIGDDLAVSASDYACFVICVVISICTYLIITNDKKK